MKRKMNVVFAVLLCLAMVFSFAACGGGGDSDTPAADPPAADTPADDPTIPDEGADATDNLTASKAIDISTLKGSDGQLLLIYGDARPVPDRPADPDSLKDDDPLKYWDIEYAGRNTEKADPIQSPADGIIGKKIIMIGQSEHPYWGAVFNGANLAADAYGIDLTTWNPNGDLNQQNQLIDKAIAEKPDMIMLATLDAKASVQQFKKIYDAGIPSVAFNMFPSDEAMRYVTAITGPDDFGQFRKLATAVAEEVGGKAGVAYITHLPGGSPYFARAYGPISTYATDFPDMKTLDLQSPGFEAPKAKQVVADWITKFGDKLNVIILSDDSAQAEGAAQAIKEAGRDDIKVVAAGNSKVGMDLVKNGGLWAITYQSAEADGAIPIKVAADYFNGEKVENAYYLPQAIITKDNVEEYEPAAW
jgi:ribose transport system substrate-binding protein